MQQVLSAHTYLSVLPHLPTILWYLKSIYVQQAQLILSNSVVHQLQEGVLESDSLDSLLSSFTVPNK